MGEGNERPRSKDLTDEELRAILAAHQSWLDTDEREGERADLSNIVDLKRGQLAGANLSGARMPRYLDRFREIDHIDQTVSIARPIFLVAMLICIYTLMTIFSTNDINIITNTPTQLLPETPLGIPVSSFFIYVPGLLFLFYIYLHLYLYRMWQILSGLPSVFQDGTPLDQEVSPWLATSFVRFYQQHGVPITSMLGFAQKWFTIIVIWWVTPLTLLLIWVRYLVRHDWTGTSFHIFLVAMIIWSAFILQWYCRSALRREPTPLRGARGFVSSAAILAGLGGVFFVLSYGAIEHAGRETLFTNAVRMLGIRSTAQLDGSDFARQVHLEDNRDLSGVDLRGASLVKSNLRGFDLRHVDLRWADLTESDLVDVDLRNGRLDDAILWKADLSGNSNLSNSSLRGAKLDRANLVDADMRGAKLAGANLHGADLKGTKLANADLSNTDLSDTDVRSSDLFRTDLRSADLSRARLNGSHLFGANMEGAKLHGTRLEGVDLLRAKGLSQEQLDQACGEIVMGLPVRLKVKPCPDD
jgi:uncharacterized protein YjbI with pentapeptide repeats